MRGTDLPAALKIWNASHAEKAIIVEDKPDELPPAFMKKWAEWSELGEFRGCSMPAAYRVWLDALVYAKEGKPSTASVVAPLPNVGGIELEPPVSAEEREARRAERKAQKLAKKQKVAEEA